MNGLEIPATRGLKAIRAEQKAARARAKKPETLDEAVSNSMDAGLANLEAKNLLKTPENLVSACGETIQSDFRLAFIVDTLKQIAFSGLKAGGQWQLYVVSADGGAPQRLLPESEAGIDSTWSPDGIIAVRTTDWRRYALY